MGRLFGAKVGFSDSKGAFKGYMIQGSVRDLSGLNVSVIMGP